MANALCEEALAQMSAFIDGELTSTIASQVELHLITCDACVRVCANALQIDSAMFMRTPKGKELMARLQALAQKRGHNNPGKQPDIRAAGADDSQPPRPSEEDQG